MSQLHFFLNIHLYITFQYIYFLNKHRPILLLFKDSFEPNVRKEKVIFLKEKFWLVHCIQESKEAFVTCHMTKSLAMSSSRV